MKTMRSTFLFLIISCTVFSQQQNHRSRSELGVLVGGSNYIGDLNSLNPFYNLHPAGGLIYRYNQHSRLAWRASLLYGTVSASDADSKEPLLANRNLSFKSTVYEVHAGLEFNYLPFQIGHEKYKGTAYLMTGISLFRMNPMAEYNDEWIELQPLGTEGQGSSLSDEGNYSLTQLSVPLGVGVRFSLGKRSSIGFEYGLRKTFTDYLDDVGSNGYVDASILSEENGPLAAALSNRSIDGSRFGKRGTDSTKDWYTFFGATLTFRLGKPNKCFNH
ncbi:MAG: hypothetical protein RIT43_2151 [Bacteroidota bacterium]